RHGGTATIRSQPGEGTEVELTVPVTAVADPVAGHAEQAMKSDAEQAARGDAQPAGPTAQPTDSADGPAEAANRQSAAGTVRMHAEPKG
ncbi:MAG: hypothetical protein ABWZ98_08295, partial [Nakamurella sp.]